MGLSVKLGRSSPLVALGNGDVLKQKLLISAIAMGGGNGLSSVSMFQRIG